MKINVLNLVILLLLIPKTIIYFIVNLVLIFLIILKYSLTDPEQFFVKLKKILIY